MADREAPTPALQFEGWDDGDQPYGRDDQGNLWYATYAGDWKPVRGELPTHLSQEVPAGSVLRRAIRPWIMAAKRQQRHHQKQASFWADQVDSFVQSCHRTTTSLNKTSQ